jgi:hypothetical protein
MDTTRPRGSGLADAFLYRHGPSPRAQMKAARKASSLIGRPLRPGAQVGIEGRQP